MNYKEFKNTIESVKVVDETFYNKLVNQYGRSFINNFFETYINDTRVEDNIDKFNRTNYYVELYINSNDEELTENDEIYNAEINSYAVKSSIQMYLNEIGNIPTLTVEEEVNLANKLSEFREIVERKNISIEAILNQLRSLGYEDKNSYENINASTLENILFKVNQWINKVNEPSKKLEATVLLKDLKVLYTYHAIVEKFMIANLRLVVSIAKRYIGHNLDFLDLIQEGNIGLSKAIDKFDVQKGYKFSTYATWWIRQAITRSIADTGKTIRIPVHFTELINKVKSVESYLETLYYRKPTDEEIIAFFRESAKKELIENGITNPTQKQIDEKCKLNQKKLNEVRSISQDITSLDMTVGEEEDCPLTDFISGSDNVEEEAISGFTKNYIKNNIQKIPEKRSRLIIILRFGLSLEEYMSLEDFKEAIRDKNSTGITTYRNGKHSITCSTNDKDLTKLYLEVAARVIPLTLEDTAALWGVTRERIRQIEAKAVRRLKRYLQQAKVDLVLK